MSTHEHAHITLLSSYYTLSLQIRERGAWTRTVDEKFVFIVRVERPRTLKHLGTCLRSSCGCVIFRGRRISYRPRSAMGFQEINATYGCTVHRREITSSLWESRELEETRSQPILDLRRPERTNLIMRLCLSPSLFVSVRDPPFRVNPAKWRECRQPNNQTINHRRGGRFALAGVPFTSPVNRAFCRISTSKHTRWLRRLVKPTNPRSWRTVFRGRRSSGSEAVVVPSETRSYPPSAPCGKILRSGRAFFSLEIAPPGCHRQEINALHSRQINI